MVSGSLLGRELPQKGFEVGKCRKPALYFFYGSEVDVFIESRFA